ncbi:MAG: CPBP family intramembrane glutamic endopeptidase [Cyclobacteriaceae bacterium]
MEMIRNASPFWIAVITMIVLGLVMLLPIEGSLQGLGFSEFQAEYIGVFFKMGLLAALSLVVLKKLNVFAIAGLSGTYPWKYKYLNVVPVYLFIVGIATIASKDLLQIQAANLLVLLLGCLAVGFAEEFLFRGILQSLFLKKFITRKGGLLIGIFIPALLFGLFHFVNFIKSGEIAPVLIQVIFASFIGFFFGVLVIKTNKLIPLAFTHGLINFFLSLQTLPGLQSKISDALPDQGGASIAPLILFLPLLIIAFFVFRTINKVEVDEKLKISF